MFFGNSNVGFNWIRGLSPGEDFGGYLAHHIFFIMNNLNKAVSDAYVSRFLKGERVVYLYLRPSIEPNSDIEGFELFSDNSLKFISDKTILHFFVSIVLFKYKYLERFDKKIRATADKEAFYAYVPHVYLDFLQMAISHPDCKGCYLVEEGDASYLRDRFKDPFGVIEKRGRSLRSLFLKIMGIRKRVAGEAFFPDESKILGAIGLGKDSFPFYRKSLIRLDPTEVFNGGGGSGASLPDPLATHLFLIDPLVHLGKISSRDYINALQKFVTENRGYISSSRVLLSFHPTIRHNKNFCGEIIDSVFRDAGIELEEFEGNIEKYLASNPGAVVFGLLSSSMRYGSLIGCGVITWLKYIEPEMLASYSELEAYHGEVGVFSARPGQGIVKTA